ncbi:hypothetical protein M8J77_011808 [Diaphorina citri]|nr:hypothetical protein M8J77_011808 [Diaphorina citri]
MILSITKLSVTYYGWYAEGSSLLATSYGKYMKLAVELSGYNYVDYFTHTTHSFNGKSKKISLEFGDWSSKCAIV